MLDRTIPPAFRTIDAIAFPQPESYTLANGLPIFVLRAGSQPVIRLELLFAAGSWYEPACGIAYFAAKMLKKGTKHKNAHAIAAYLAQYGASLAIDVQPDYWSMCLTALTKHLSQLLDLLLELLLAPTFEEAPLELAKHLTTQQIKVAEEKVRYIARQHCQAALFGADHPYGRQLTPAAIAAITSEQLQQYYHHHLLAGCQVFISGQVTDAAMQAVEHALPSLPTYPPQHCTHLLAPGSTHAIHVPKAGSLQAAIHLGSVLFPQNHPDYLPFCVVNALLGGYFGSRLMRNLREEKGYTYGVVSRIFSLQHTSYLSITTEVMESVAEAACQEIHTEIRLLQTQAVGQEELQRLKNYLLGHFLASTNDPFSMMSRFQEAYLHGLEKGYEQRWYQAITHIQPDTVLALANQYLSRERLVEVTVG